jgi:hypothetical protein
MTYYDTFLEYIKNTVNYKMSVLDPNVIKKFLYAISMTPNNSQSTVKVNSREVDD